MQTEVRVRACVRACLRVGSKRDGVVAGSCACVGSTRARTIEYTRDRCRMSSIIMDGDTFHGISVFGRGVFTDDTDGRWTYAGQHRGGYACGLGMLTWSHGHKAYAEHGPDGKLHGRQLVRSPHGETWYTLFERGKQKDSGDVFDDGRCKYNGELCAPDDPRLLALIAQVAPVEVRPAAPATQLPSLHNSPPSNRPMDRPARFAPAGAGGRLCHRGAAPHTVAGGCATQPNSGHTAKHVNTVTRTRAFSRYWSHGRHPLAPTDNRRLGHTKGLSRQRHCQAIVQHTAVPNAATRGGLYVSVHMPHATSPEPSWPGFAVLASCFGLAGRGSRGQPASALGGARALRPTKFGGVL